MRARLVRIGNSRGIRLAKPLLEEAGLIEDVEIQASPGLITITPVVHPRTGWAEAAAVHPSEGLLDQISTTHFDQQDWVW